MESPYETFAEVSEVVLARACLWLSVATVGTTRMPLRVTCFREFSCETNAALSSFIRLK